MAQRNIDIDIAEGIGGPSSTAVFRETQLPEDRVEQVQVLKKAITKLADLGHHMSKCAVISTLSDGDEMSFRSVQIRGLDKSGELVLEIGKNCGNSIVASTFVALREKYGSPISRDKVARVLNRDTGFAADMNVVNSDGDQSIAFDMDVISLVGRVPADSLLEGSEPTWRVPFGRRDIPITTLDAVNPYIVVPAGELGIDSIERLLKIEDNPADILDRLNAIRSAVINILAYPQESEFPKVAIAHREGSNIVARTVYRAGWHPVLPITASISLAVSSRISGSVIAFDSQDEGQDTLTIRTPREAEQLKLRIDPKTGTIIECVLKNRKAVLRHCNIKMCF